MTLVSITSNATERTVNSFRTIISITAIGKRKPGISYHVCACNPNCSVKPTRMQATMAGISHFRN